MDSMMRKSAPKMRNCASGNDNFFFIAIAGTHPPQHITAALAPQNDVVDSVAMWQPVRRRSLSQLSAYMRPSSL
jgi:hypothetical protein